MNDDEDVESLVGLPIALFTKTIYDAQYSKHKC
jgi:hypothetical protein